MTTRILTYHFPLNRLPSYLALVSIVLTYFYCKLSLHVYKQTSVKQHRLQLRFE